MLHTKRFRLIVVMLILIVCIAARRLFIHRGAPETAESSASQTEAVTAEADTPQPDETAVSAAACTDDSAPPQATTTAVSEIICHADSPYLPAQKLAEIRERFRIVQKNCPDLIGWLFVAESDIDLPVVQGTDNEHYLYYAPDGTRSDYGTVFLDCQASSDFSDLHSLLYGHNMVKGMFGDIRSFKEQEAFDRHRYGWLITPTEINRIDFFVLSVASGTSLLYDMQTEHSQWMDLLLKNTLLKSEISPAEDDRIIALSTCSPEFRTARALFAGILVRIENEEDIIEK